MKLTIRVKPGSSRNQVGGAYPLPDTPTPALVVATTAPAVDGKANTAVIKLLAKALKLRSSDIVIRSGHTTRTKTLELPDSCAPEIAKLLSPLAASQ
ncbi:MAG: DUF167 domain-containing protein [Propionibacteriaceae bacterium]|jgi:uncharacterized protein (TIGR00251 family)|nr:DUF167 domain-containing protein [Propionibacteriaceae bacterium]